MIRKSNAERNAEERAKRVVELESRPLNLTLTLSFVCNANCVFCVADKHRVTKKDPLAFAKLDFLDRMEDLLPYIGCFVLSSPEVMLHPRVKEFRFPLLRD
jgi:MoaA/NifB/PqqE/SkfB family radical SAM enzyme